MEHGAVKIALFGLSRTRFPPLRRMGIKGGGRSPELSVEIQPLESTKGFVAYRIVSELGESCYELC
ncbi:unnamed protein product [Arctogadus glacialis]